MALQRNREEVINTQLAILISRLGVTAEAETIHVHGRQRPDVLFELRGLRVIIEGKFADHPDAEQIVLEEVLDVRSLSSKQLKKLSGSYDALSIQHLDPISNLNSDIVRGQIDQAIGSTLEIPDLDFVRELLDREPGLSANEISPRADKAEFPDEDDEDDAQTALPIKG